MSPGDVLIVSDADGHYVCRPVGALPFYANRLSVASYFARAHAERTGGRIWSVAEQAGSTHPRGTASAPRAS